MYLKKERELLDIEESVGRIYQKEADIKQVILKEQFSYQLIKRGIDIIGSILGLLVFLPIMLVIFFAIKVEDGGSVFFAQVRVGKGGKRFLMYKIRSMCMDAEKRMEEVQEKNEIQGPMFKMKNDPRITKVGKFIRKSSLDELPQLLNVLLGNMSLVGPRPPLPREVADYDAYEMQRLFVKPGCSGLWQISGRSDLHFSDMVKLDLQYIENRSLRLDFKIILKTFLVFFSSNGAY
ncbi:sugar transferase [Enterococcus pallens]|uniref:Bacterial sugar transferase domain-containing protein n=1 Tax=Enterococcus pallens ATCC BAA-351 TaxID=1158607 RepID=R2T0M6_9ENTE|nr:sugar transferase [Enterococcus pallens]EOH93809.1 hypothetical protein UAU_02505 [Enterococcus pallens ATCC BAA-351]EOU24649.1 hypothetical protein I588_00636 [Enterococcus pallens ATCC BAA-351]OJG79530.1 hypothetical protein RV10_GL000657 [Enterococcus pallens]